MSAEQFRALADELAPLESRTSKIKIEMMALAQQMGLGMLQREFPGARIMTVKPIIEIKPSNLAEKAQEAIAAVKRSGVSPTLIIVDTARCLLTLATEDNLPPAANVKATKPAKRKRDPRSFSERRI